MIGFCEIQGEGLMQDISDSGCRHTIEAILDYVSAELPPGRAAEVEVHLSECPECRAREAFERQLRERLQELRSAPVRDRLRIRVHVILAEAHAG